MNEDSEQSAAILRERGGEQTFEMAIVLGSGLGSAAEGMENTVTVPYSELPGFPRGAISGHDGQVMMGMIEGARVIVLRGRAHFYETGDAAAMAVPLETLALLGVQNVLLTCAAGSVRADIYPGNLVMITDHINFGGLNPLIGLSADGGFVNMTEAYDARLARRIKRATLGSGVSIHDGIYMWFSGPSFETPAEIKMARTLGADLVGMSIVPEVILARRLALHVGAIAVITNFGAGFQNGNPTHADTLQQAQSGSISLRRLLRALLKTRDLGR